MMKLLDWIEPSKLDYDGLSCNPSDGAIKLLENYPEKIYWRPEKINWPWLSMNSHPKALEWLEKNPDKINWCLLSRNPNSKALDLLEQNPDKINWYYLSANTHPKALELLEKNPEKINWFWLSSNPLIFVYDYEAMETNCLVYKEELMKERFHPKNLYKFTSWGFNGIDEEEE